MPRDKKDLNDSRATAPAALEDHSDTAWAEFQALQQGGAAADAYAPTKQGSLPGALKTEPAPLTANKSAGKPAITLDAALTIARRRNRACPMPLQWKKLFDLMQQQAPAGTAPPLPIDAKAWNTIAPMQKRMRLREQLEWCARYDLLEPATAFLVALPDKDWLHL